MTGGAQILIQRCHAFLRFINDRNKYIVVHFTARATIIVWSICKYSSYKELEYHTRLNISVSTISAQLALAAHFTHYMSQNCRWLLHTVTGLVASYQ